MRHLTLLFALLLLGGPMALAQNPIAQFYDGPEGYPDWTNQIDWDNRINMAEYENGSDNFEKFKNARDELAQQGGGVLYYPGGTYEFDIPDGPNNEGLMLKEGVVILGDKPQENDHAVVNEGTTEADFKEHGMDSLPTRFVFARHDVNGALQNVTPAGGAKIPRMWNMIGTQPADADRVGVAWVQLDYGYIYMGVTTDWGNTWETAGGWLSNKTVFGWGKRKPDGTHPMDAFAGLDQSGHTPAKMGEKRFIMGVHIKNGCVPNYAIDKPGRPEGFVLERGGWRFGARIGVYGKHVFVANNLISVPDSNGVFRYDIQGKKDGEWITTETIFDPAKTGGIDVNKSHMSFYDNKCDVDDPNGFYAPNVVIRDNWIYNHGGKGIEAAGTWGVIRDNVNYRHALRKEDVYNIGSGEPLEFVLHPSDGRLHASESAADFLSRGIDYGGWNMWIHANRFTGVGSIGNDGNGVFTQRHTGIEAYSFAVTHNKQGPTGETGNSIAFDNHVVGLFYGWNDFRGTIGVNNDAQKGYTMDYSLMQNEANKITGIGTNSPMDRDGKVADCPGEPKPFLSPEVSVADSGNFVQISWTDVEREMAYRVDRRPQGGGNWRTIAFRPRKKTGGRVHFSDNDTTVNDTLIPGLAGFGAYQDFDWSACWDGKIRNMNQQVWRDYIGPPDDHEYRVVAVTCDDSTVTHIPSKAVHLLEAQVYPNPASDRLQIETGLEAGETGNLQLVGLNGQVVRRQNLEGGLQQRITLPTQNLESGMYLLRIRTSRGGRFSQKVVIR